MYLLCCRIQVEVENMSEKRTLLHMLENLKQKRAWLAFDVERSRLDEVMLCSKSDEDIVIWSWAQV